MHNLRLLLFTTALSTLCFAVSESIVTRTGSIGTTGEWYVGFVQLSNDHSGKDNEGFHDVTKMILTFLLSSLACLIVVISVQMLLNLSKEYRYEVVKLRKNYRNLKRASQLPLVSA